jgi:Fic family protein
VAIDAADRARQLYRRVSEDRRALLAADGVTLSAIQLFEHLPDHPVITMPQVTRLLDVTKPTAGKAINALQSAGILQELGARKRDRLYSYAPYIEILK